jgi:hypothetical protein
MNQLSYQQLSDNLPMREIQILNIFASQMFDIFIGISRELVGGTTWNFTFASG